MTRGGTTVEPTADLNVRSDRIVVDRGELHVHINGAIPVSTVRDVLIAEKTELPVNFDLEHDMIRRVPSDSLA